MIGAALAGMASACLFVLGLRRLVFAVVSLLPARPFPAGDSRPSVLILVTAWNESAVVAGTLHAIEELDYPPERVEVTLVDDGSTDGTAALLERWAGGRSRHRVVRTGRRAGRSTALNLGLAASPHTDLVAVVDADLRLAPDALGYLARTFADERVGAASGHLRPGNAGRGIVARYAALETWVHQLVTSAAKDRLALDPPPLGVWLVRRDLLHEIGGFPVCASGEDVRTAAALAARGRRTRFTSRPVASNEIAQTLGEYWWQHLRWARDVYEAERRERRPPPRSSEDGLTGVVRRTERMLSSAGYADRLALLAAIALAGGGLMSPAVPAAYLAVLAVEVGVALHRGGVGATEAARVLAASAVMLVVDAVATAVATTSHGLGTSRRWTRPERRHQPDADGEAIGRPGSSRRSENGARLS